MRGITRDCAIELLQRKVIWLYIIVAVLMISTIVVAGKLSLGVGSIDFDDIDAKTFVEFRAQNVTAVLYGFLWALVGLAVLVTAGQFPTMLVPGRAEFYLSKPISRTSLYLNKLLAALTVYGMVLVVFGLIGWATIYLLYSHSTLNFLYMIALNILSLFIWLTIVSFGGIVFGSTSMAIVGAGVIFIAQLLLQGREWTKQLIDSNIADSIIDALYYIVPKTGEISDITLRVAGGEPVSSWLPVHTSMAFAVVIIIITAVIFKRKNF